MFYEPVDSKHAYHALPGVIHAATHDPDNAQSFEWCSGYMPRAVLANPDMRDALWQAHVERAVTYDAETGTLRAFSETLAQSFTAPDGRVMWALRVPRVWGAYPSMEEGNKMRNPTFDATDHIKVALAVLHAVYGHEPDGTPRAAMGVFAHVMVAYTPHGIIELLPGRVVALIPDSGVVPDVLADFRKKWGKPDAKRRTTRVTGDPLAVRPAPLIRNERELDLFLTGRLRFPPMRPVAPRRPPGNLSQERLLELDDAESRFRAEIVEWEDKYDIPRVKRPALTLRGARGE